VNAQVVFLPSHLRPGQLDGRACVVFDVLRATTTMAAALAAGVREIYLFDTLEAAHSAASAHKGARLLCGEAQCLPPAGFDLGNSPGQFNESHRDATLFMCTTNGTRALLAARSSAALLTGAVVNASAVATELRRIGRDVTLLCAGTNGNLAMEDVLGAGAVLDALNCDLVDDAARIALRLFRACRDDLRAVMGETEGGRNVVGAGLEPDITFAARLDAVSFVGIALGNPLIVRAI
jgi:2-phosphosulfolactate phosphatase